MAATKYYKITEKELLALISTADTVYSIGACGDEDLELEAKAAQKAIKAIEKRNGIIVERNFSTEDFKI